MASRRYERLTSDDEADDEADDPPAAPRAGLDPETAQKLQKKFLDHVAQARSKQKDDGIVVQLVVGSDAWVIDLRPQVPLARVVLPGRALAPEVRVAVSPEDLQSLLDGRLSPFRAWQNKQLVVSGSLGKLRSMTWLRQGGPSDGAAEAQNREGLGVRVVGTSTEGGYGTYVLRVTEGATAWTVTRRWSEVKTLTRALHREYGAGTPFGLRLPSLRASVRSAMVPHATGASVLLARSQQLEVHLARTLRLLHTSAKAAVGPPLLLAFLGAAQGTLQPPKAEGDAVPEAAARQATLLSEDSEYELLEVPSPLPEAAPPPLIATTDMPLSPGAGSARANGRATGGGTGGGAGGREGGRELPLSQLRLVVEAEEAKERAAALQARMRCARAWSAASLLAWMLAAAWGAAAALPPMPPLPPLPPPPAPLLAVLLLLPLLPLLPALSLLGGGGGGGGGAPRLALQWRAAYVTYTFWLMVAHYRVTRARARVVDSAGGDADAVWYAAHEHTGDVLRERFGRLRGLWTKLGQYLASRSDVVPVPIVARLSTMLDNNEAQPLAVIVRTLIEELGDERAAAIATIDPTPLSTASIAQARSQPGGRTRWGLGPPGFLLRMRTLTALHGSPPPPLAGARGSAGVGRASGAQGTARRGGLPLRAGPRAEREARRVACEGRGMPIGGLSNSGRSDEIESATRSHARPPHRHSRTSTCGGSWPSVGRCTRPNSTLVSRRPTCRPSPPTCAARAWWRRCPTSSPRSRRAACW